MNVVLYKGAPKGFNGIGENMQNALPKRTFKDTAIIAPIQNEHNTVQNEHPIELIVNN